MNLTQKNQITSKLREFKDEWEKQPKNIDKCGKLLQTLKELELLKPEELFTNLYVKFPVMMEQYLMEGSYNSIFMARESRPANSYTFFIEILLHTIRDDIGDCLEKAYSSIGIKDAAKLLFFKDEKDADFKSYVEKKAWPIQGNIINFGGDTKSILAGTNLSDKLKPYELMHNALTYAKELEKIV